MSDFDDILADAEKINAKALSDAEAAKKQKDLQDQQRLTARDEALQQLDQVSRWIKEKAKELFSKGYGVTIGQTTNETSSGLHTPAMWRFTVELNKIDGKTRGTGFLAEVTLDGRKGYKFAVSYRYSGVSDLGQVAINLKPEDDKDIALPSFDEKRAHAVLVSLFKYGTQVLATQGKLK